MTRAERTFPAELRVVRDAVAFAAERAAGALPRARLLHLELAVEEAVVNVCRYAYGGRPGTYRVCIHCEGTEVTVEIEDDGEPFDPLEAPEPDLDAPLEERRVGGLGILLIRKMASEARYRRAGRSNVLTLVMRPDMPGP